MQHSSAWFAVLDSYVAHATVTKLPHTWLSSQLNIRLLRVVAIVE